MKYGPMSMSALRPRNKGNTSNYHEQLVNYCVYRHTAIIFFMKLIFCEQQTGANKLF